MVKYTSIFKVFLNLFKLSVHRRDVCFSAFGDNLVLEFCRFLFKNGFILKYSIVNKKKTNIFVIKIFLRFMYDMPIISDIKFDKIFPRSYDIYKFVIKNPYKFVFYTVQFGFLIDDDFFYLKKTLIPSLKGFLFCYFIF